MHRKSVQRARGSDLQFDVMKTRTRAFINVSSLCGGDYLRRESEVLKDFDNFTVIFR